MTLSLVLDSKREDLLMERNVWTEEIRRAMLRSAPIDRKRQELQKVNAKLELINELIRETEAV